MNLFELIIMAIVQGLTEFIPVSSSGHLVILERWFEADSSVALEIMLHVGTLIALLVYFRMRVYAICRDVISEHDTKLALNLVVSTIPVVVAGFLVAKLVDDTSWRSVGLVSFMLIAVGVAMLAADAYVKTEKERIGEVTLKDAVIVGLFQAVSIIPGTSRSGITMIGARLRGMAYDLAAEYSFLIAIPALLGATFYVLLSEGASSLSAYGNGQIITTIVVAAGVGYGAIGIMLKLLKKYGFKPFAYYRIALGILLLLTLL